MLHKKLTILYLLFSLSTFTVYSQNCDCNIFPVKKECKQECGLKDLQSGSEEELVKKDKPVLFVVIDNLRYDQWKVIENVVANHY